MSVATIRQLFLKGTCTGYTPQDRAALKRLRSQMAGVLTIFMAVGATQAFGPKHPQGAAAVTIAVMQGVCFAAILGLAWAIALRAGDEFRRLLLWRSLAWGVGVTVAFASVWGYLELCSTQVPRIPLLMLPIVLIGSTAVAKIVIFHRERAGL